MPFRPYAEDPTRRSLQVIVDVLAVVVLVLAARAAVAVHDALAGLAGPGQRLEDVATGVSGQLGELSERTVSIPLVGDTLTGPLRSMQEEMGGLAVAGQQVQDVVATIARVAGALVFVVPLVLLVAVWLLPRVRFARRAGAARALLDAGPDPGTTVELFALRAMARQPLTRLAEVSPDPVGAWRRGDAAVVRALADLELRRAGLRVPGRGSDPRAELGRYSVG